MAITDNSANFSHGNSELAHRLSLLERQLRRANFLASTGIGLACIMSLLAIFLSLVVAMRTYRETVYGLLAVKTLVAEQLHVRGKSGSEAAICVDASGEPTLCFYDRTGTSRIYLGLASDGHPHIVLRDQEGRLRTQVTVPANGQSSYGRINFFGPGEKNLIEFGIDPGGQPELRFNSEDDQCRIIVDISPDRSAQLQLRSPDQSGGVQLQARDGRGSAITVITDGRARRTTPRE